MATTPVTSLAPKSQIFPLENRIHPHYLGSFVCNILGDKTYLYLKKGQLEAHIYHRKGDVTILSSSQIQGGKDGNMPLKELNQLVTTVASPFLFASYQNNTLRLFARD